MRIGIRLSARLSDSSRLKLRWQEHCLMNAYFAHAAKLGTTDLDARSDIHADRDYRRGLLTTVLTRALQKAARQTDT